MERKEGGKERRKRRTEIKRRGEGRIKGKGGQDEKRWESRERKACREREGGRAAIGRQDGAGRELGAAVALCSPLACRAFAAGPAPGAAATSVRTQRRKRPPLLPLPGDLLGWVH